MVIVVALAFIVAWSPHFLVSMISQHQKESFLIKSNYFLTMLMTHLFGFINSCINPFIYTAMSEKFRSSFRRTLGFIFCKICFGHEKYSADFSAKTSMLQRSMTIMTSASRSENDDMEEGNHYDDRKSSL